MSDDYEDDVDGTDDDFNDDSQKFITSIKYTVHVTRIIGNTVYPTKWEIKCDMEILPDNFYDELSKEETDIEKIEEDAEEEENNDVSKEDYQVILPNATNIEEIIPFFDNPKHLSDTISEIRKELPGISDDDCIKTILEQIDDSEDSDVDDDEYLQQTDDFSNAKLGLSKIKFWIENLVSGSIVFCRNNKWARRSFLTKSGHIAVNNHLMILPNDPTDSLIAQVLHSKFNALSDGFILFETVHIESNNDPNDISYFFYGDGKSSLPPMKDWMGEPHWFKNPWWARDDASTIDVICPDDADMSEPPKFAYSLDFLGDIVNPPVYEDSKIVRADFRPKVIKGGNDDRAD